jgi:selenocysteine-specific translation elongation factor
MAWNTAFYGEWIDLGKKSAPSDIQQYNHKSSEGVFTYTAPAMYPDKVSSLILPAMLSNIAVVHVTPEYMDYKLGETIVLLDSLKKPGFFAANDSVAAKLPAFIKGTSLEKWEVIPDDAISVKEKVKSFNVAPIAGPCRVLVDASFEVRSVGTVVLGIVTQGSVSQHDKLTTYPGGQEVMVKSIQKHDEDYKTAEFNDRVGLALKGTSAEEVPRGTILSAEPIKVADRFPAKLNKSRFFAGAVPRDMHLCVGMQWVGFHFDGNDAVCAKKIALHDTIGVVAVQAPPGKLRVVGSLSF